MVIAIPSSYLYFVLVFLLFFIFISFLECFYIFDSFTFFSLEASEVIHDYNYGFHRHFHQVSFKHVTFRLSYVLWLRL